MDQPVPPYSAEGGIERKDPEGEIEELEWLVRSSGFEPPRYCYRQPLKLVRLPVPPRPPRKIRWQILPLNPKRHPFTLSNTTDCQAKCAYQANRCHSERSEESLRSVHRAKSNVALDKDYFAGAAGADGFAVAGLGAGCAAAGAAGAGSEDGAGTVGSTGFGGFEGAVTGAPFENCSNTECPLVAVVALT